ncbi:DUF485 domain-containing protein [Streptomyces albus]|uniref:DUF485 domain-containing protein n=1 Tax=Streptomyces sp. NRRL F-5917 TaxID=1463873 RepID=UPI0004C0A970|nr:DUF485 domain-containing protein [Streptomyces sp. NRRL F-5917]
MRLDDHWYDAAPAASSPAVPPQAPHPSPASQPSAVPPQHPPVPPSPHDAYLTVQRSAAFQQVRSRYRRFVLPAGAAFLLWYLAYVVCAVSAPGLMARPVAGVLNVAMVAGLAQFATTFLLTWLYARHARLRRDGIALELRWATQEMTRGTGAAAITVGRDAR